jgi:hypothetical protein
MTTLMLKTNYNGILSLSKSNMYGLPLIIEASARKHAESHVQEI